MSTTALPWVMLQLNTMAVVVRNDQKAAKWYHDKLGLRVATRFPHWVTAATRGSTVTLHLSPDPPPRRGKTGISFGTKHVAKKEKEQRNKGVKSTVPTTKTDYATPRRSQ